MEGMHTAEDNVRPPVGQEFVVMSTTSADNKVPGLDCAICVRGMFSTLEAAQKHAKRIASAKCRFNTYIGHANAWVALPPRDEDLQEEKYDDERLDQIMHMENDARKRAEESFQKRLSEAKKEGKDYTSADWVQEQRPASEMEEV